METTGSLHATLFAGPPPLRGSMRWHGPQRVEGEVRVHVQRAVQHLIRAETILQQRLDERDAARCEFDEYHSQGSAHSRAQAATQGLSFAAIQELRSLNIDPPIIVQLVLRCVCTLLAVEAKPECVSSKVVGTATRCAPRTWCSPGRITKGGARPPHAIAAGGDFDGSAWGKQCITLDKSHAHAHEAYASSMAGMTPSVVATRCGLIGWKESMRIVRRPDFKQRLLTLDALMLIGDPWRIQAVRLCLDLSPARAKQPLSIRVDPHRGGRAIGLASRRLTSKTYARHTESGVALASPLKFEEARFANEVAGAMVIWIQRIFEQVTSIISETKRLEQKLEAGRMRVVSARVAVDERLAELGKMATEYKWAPKLIKQQVAA